MHLLSELCGWLGIDGVNVSKCLGGVGAFSQRPSTVQIVRSTGIWDSSVAATTLSRNEGRAGRQSEVRFNVKDK